MHGVGIESKTEGLMAEFAKLQKRCKKDRHSCPGKNYDSEASQPKHRLIIAPDGKQGLLLSRDAGFAVPVELRGPAILCVIPDKPVSVPRPNAPIEHCKRFQV